MLDTSTKVNVITQTIVDKLRLLVYINLLLALKAVLGDTKVFNRAYKDVEIDIKGIVNYQTLLVLNESKHTFILRAPFFYNAQVTFKYNDTRNQYTKVLGEDQEKVATIQVCVL